MLHRLNRTRRWVFPFMMLGAFLCASLASGNEAFRPFDFSELAPFGLRYSRVFHLPHARVVFADYIALWRDFPALAHLSETELDQWILSEFAYVSETQLTLQGVRNSMMGVDMSLHKTEARPPGGWGRAGYLEARIGGRIAGTVNIKGLGLTDEREAGAQRSTFERATSNGAWDRADKIKDEDHGDGLMSVGEAVAEVVKQRVIQAEFAKYNHPHKTYYQTVESYFIIDTGFDILKSGNQAIPAALYGRQSHWGRLYNALDVPNGIYFDPWVQSTWTGAAVDFGNVRLANEPNNPQKSKIWSEGHESAVQFRNGQKDAVSALIRLRAPNVVESPPDFQAFHRIDLMERLRSYKTLNELFRDSEWEDEEVLFQRIFAGISQERQFRFLDSMDQAKLIQLIRDPHELDPSVAESLRSAFMSWVFFRGIEDPTFLSLKEALLEEGPCLRAFQY